ncbi:MAG: metallophosphoesterase [Desulfobacterales bacterium]|nr:metallophosphoesterase [Desulfobacterales bacterium]
MILIISDTHSYYNTINHQIRHAEFTMGTPVSCVIHLGDFGIYKSSLHDFFIKQKQRFLKPVYFIEGNHEDHNALPKLTKKYKDYFTHLSRGKVFEINGLRFLCLGGTAYMDAMNTQLGAIISDNNINECLSIPSDKVDIIITHDCPAGIGVPNTPGLEFFSEPGFERSAELGIHFKPELWLFGHHHQWFEHRDDHTSYYGFPSAWRGYGLLDEGFNIKIQNNEMPILKRKRSLMEKIFIKLKIIR